MKHPSAVPTTIDEYIADFPRPVRATLKSVRAAIRKAVPGLEEAISYRIPTFRLHGRYVIYFAGWKAHYSLYPANARLVAAFEDELAPYEVNNKGTIRFPLDAPVPVDLIAGITRFRVEEVEEELRAKKAAAKNPAAALANSLLAGAAALPAKRAGQKRIGKKRTRTGSKPATRKRPDSKPVDSKPARSRRATKKR